RLLILRALRIRTCDEILEKPRMSIPDIGYERAFFQLFDRERSYHLQHVEPITLAPYQALVNERGNGIERSVADGFRRLDREASRENAELREERTFGVAEQVVTPRKRVSHRLMARGRVTIAGRQQFQSVRHSFHHCVWRQQSSARRSELDRQRQAVQALANLRDCWRVLFGQREGRLYGFRPFDEQCNRCAFAEE